MDSTVKTTVVNLHGGPGVGKSTMMAGMFHELKRRGKSAEMAHEFAKDLIWDQAHATFADQAWLFANQYRRINRLVGQVDFVITDSPLLLSVVFGRDMPQEFKDWVFYCHDHLDNYDIQVGRDVPYETAGRNEDADAAIELDNRIAGVLRWERGDTHLVQATSRTPAERLVDDLLWWDANRPRTAE